MSQSSEDLPLAKLAVRGAPAVDSAPGPAAQQPQGAPAPPAQPKQEPATQQQQPQQQAAAPAAAARPAAARLAAGGGDSDSDDDAPLLARKAAVKQGEVWGRVVLPSWAARRCRGPCLCPAARRLATDRCAAMTLKVHTCCNGP